MATTTELITEIETILSNGLESVQIGDRNLRYRSIEDLAVILQQLKRKASGSTGWNTIYMKQGSE